MINLVAASIREAVEVDSSLTRDGREWFVVLAVGNDLVLAAFGKGLVLGFVGC